MSQPSDGSTQDPPRRRPWYRLHRSTYVVAVLLLVTLVLLIAPGEWCFDCCESTYAEGFEHGWPWTFLLRLDVEPPQPSVAAKRFGPPEIWDGPPWLHEAGWSLAGERNEVWPYALLADAAVGLLILVVGVAAFEWWRRRRQRLWQFSLRELLLGVLLVAGGLGWWRYNHLRSQQDVRTLRGERSAASATELLLHQTVVSNRPFSTQFRAPTWLRKLLGSRMLVDFYVVESMHYWRIYDDERFQRCLDNFSQFSDPKELCLSETPLTGARLEMLTGLKRVSVLSLYLCRLDKDGIDHLAEISNLNGLELRRSAVDDAVLERIGRLSQLRELVLEQKTGFTDAGLQHVAGLTELKRLELRSSEITDAGLVHLESLKGLTRLRLVDTKATPEGIERLRQALPECEIVVQ